MDLYQRVATGLSRDYVNCNAGRFGPDMGRGEDLRSGVRVKTEYYWTSRVCVDERVYVSLRVVLSWVCFGLLSIKMFPFSVILKFSDN